MKGRQNPRHLEGSRKRRAIIKKREMFVQRKKSSFPLKRTIRSIFGIIPLIGNFDADVFFNPF